MKRWLSIVLCSWITLMFIVLLCLPQGVALAEDSLSPVVLIYERLYTYASDISEVLRQYMYLVSSGYRVLLLQADELESVELPTNTAIFVAHSSFTSKEKLQQVYGRYREYDIKEMQSYGDFQTGAPTLVLAMTEVYPFSDLEHVMDTAESLHNAGFEYIVSVMPVYRNYHLQAYDNYIQVLQYISKIGGHIFVHYPIANEMMQYNSNPKSLFVKAVSEFRNRGVPIVGMEISQDKMVTDTVVYEDLDFRCLLVTEAQRKISSEHDLWRASHKLLGYQVIVAENVSYAGMQQAVMINANHSEGEPGMTLRKLQAEQLRVEDFRLGDPYLYDGDTITPTEQQTEPERPKSELEQFLETEMDKITGDNLEDEQKKPEGYDISGLTTVALKVALAILIVLAILAFIGSYLQKRKFYK